MEEAFVLALYTSKGNYKKLKLVQTVVTQSLHKNRKHESFTPHDLSTASVGHNLSRTYLFIKRVGIFLYCPDY